MQLQTIKCTNPLCGKTLGEASGEYKRLCPKCGLVTHVVVTTKGIIDLGKVGRREKKL